MVTYNRGKRELIVETSDQAKCLSLAAFFPWLKQNFQTYNLNNKSIPFGFLGGYVGYVSYEMKEECFSELYQTNMSISRVGEAGEIFGSMPDVLLLYINRFLAFDHQNKMVYFVSQGQNSRAAKSWIQDEKQKYLRLAQLKFQPQNNSYFHEKNDHKCCFQLTHPRSRYIDNIKECLECIRSGDSYELCLTTQAVCRNRILDLNRVWGLYKNLRRSNPAPFAAYLRLGKHGAILSSSPERFFELNSNGRMECKPIKGTRRRDLIPDNDQIIVESLLNSSKDRAENLMVRHARKF